jgi:hypothetical protein
MGPVGPLGPVGIAHRDVQREDKNLYSPRMHNEYRSLAKIAIFNHVFARDNDFLSANLTSRRNEGMNAHQLWCLGTVTGIVFNKCVLSEHYCSPVMMDIKWTSLKKALISRLHDSVHLKDFNKMNEYSRDYKPTLVSDHEALECATLKVVMLQNNENISCKTKEKRERNTRSMDSVESIIEILTPDRKSSNKSISRCKMT